jgi:hypothetical protein
MQFDRRDERARLSKDLDQAFVRQPHQSLSNRGPRNTQLRGDLFFADRLSRREPQRDDGLAGQFVDLRRQRPARIDRRAERERRTHPPNGLPRTAVCNFRHGVARVASRDFPRRSRDHSAHQSVYPPSTTTTEPVMKAPASLARRSAVGAISSGDAYRCMGTSSRQ